MEHVFNIDAKILSAMAITAADKDRRGYLKGVLLECKNNNIILVSTDGSCLSAYYLGEYTGGDMQIIIPLELIKKVKAKGEITLAYDDVTKNISIVYSGTTMSQQAIDGRFPDFRRVVPKDFTPALLPLQFDPDLTVKFKKISALLSGTKRNVPHLIHLAANLAVVDIRTDNFMGVVMAYKTMGQGEAPISSRPNWLGA